MEKISEKPLQFARQHLNLMPLAGSITPVSHHYDGTFRLASFASTSMKRRSPDLATPCIGNRTSAFTGKADKTTIERQPLSVPGIFTTSHKDITPKHPLQPVARKEGAFAPLLSTRRIHSSLAPPEKVNPAVSLSDQKTPPSRKNMP